MARQRSSDALARRALGQPILLGLSVVPAVVTFWLRHQIAETSRFALAQGNTQDASHAVDMASGKIGAFIARSSSR